MSAVDEPPEEIDIPIDLYLPEEESIYLYLPVGTTQNLIAGRGDALDGAGTPLDEDAVRDRHR